jgi:hypothetical protein
MFFFIIIIFCDAMCLVSCVLLVRMDNIINSPFRFLVEALLSLRW